MTFDEYAVEAFRTNNRDGDREKRMMVMALGLAGEAGEVADLIKKAVGHGHELDLEKLKKELGDCLWYIAALSEFAGVTLADVAEANIEKLRKRYPDGFSHEASRGRTE